MHVRKQIKTMVLHFREIKYEICVSTEKWKNLIKSAYEDFFNVNMDYFVLCRYFSNNIDVFTLIDVTLITLQM